MNSQLELNFESTAQTVVYRDKDGDEMPVRVAEEKYIEEAKSKGFSVIAESASIMDWKPRSPVKGARYYRWRIGANTVYGELLPAGLRYKHKPHWGRGNHSLNMLTLWTDSGWWTETECSWRNEPTIEGAAFSQAKAFAKEANKPASEAARWFMRGRLAPWHEDCKIWGYACRVQVQYGQLMVLCTHEDKADRWRDALWLDVDYVRERGKFDIYNAPIHRERVQIHQGGFGESANRFTLENRWEDPKFPELVRILGFAIGNFLANREESK